jgi:tetratricopeptide (TPR) repeat protein
VYALGALFVVLATAAAWRWYQLRSPGTLVLAFAACGLGATNHTFMAVYALGLAIFAAAVEPALLRHPGRIAAAGAAFVAGLLPYAYLPLRSRQDPVLDWGNPETLQGFFDVVLRRDFWQRAWVESPSDLLAVIGDWAVSLGEESAWIGAALALLGLVAGVRRRWPVGLFVLVMLGNVSALALHGSRADLFIWHRYYIPSYVMLALLAGLGAQLLIERLPRPARVLPLALPLVLLVVGFQAHDRSRYRLAEAFSEEVLRALPPGAHLIATDDNVLFVLMYLHLVEGRRPDVNLILQGVGGIERPPLRFDPEREPLFMVDHPNWQLPSLEIVPVGVVFRAWRAGVPLPPVVLPDGPLPGEVDPRVPKDYLTRCLIGHYHYMLGVTSEPRDWLRARSEFEAVIEIAPDSDVLQYNLGLIFRRNGLLDDASAAFARAHAANPRALQSASRPRASERLAELRDERKRLAALEAALAAAPELRGLEPETPGYHERLAALLEERGETVAARGHRLHALEKGAASRTVSSVDAGPRAVAPGQRE